MSGLPIGKGIAIVSLPASDCVLALSRLVYGSNFSRSRYLALFYAYCDESYDDKGLVFTVAGFLAQEGEWAQLADRWKARCLQDGIECYHATDCANGWNDFLPLSDEICIALNTDLITYLTETRLAGFAVSISSKDFYDVISSDPKAREILGSDPYYLAFQLFVLQVCHEINQVYPEYPLAFVFEQNEKVSGRAKRVYDDVRKKNPELAACMGSLTYADRRKLVPLQTADELAFESMKNTLGWLQNRPDRMPIKRLKEARVLSSLNVLGRDGIEQIVKDGKINLAGEPPEAPLASTNRPLGSQT